MTQPLTSVQIQGYRSIDDLTLGLSSEVTLLIGANGSGKSNIVDAFELVGRTVDRQLGAHILRSGGFDRNLHRAPNGLSAEAVSIKVWAAEQHGHRNGYRMRLDATAEDGASVTETTFMHNLRYPTPYDVQLGTNRESVLAKRRDEHPANRYLLDALTGCRVFHFDDTSHDAPPLKRVNVSDGESLHDDARNLAAVLHEMRELDDGSYDRVVRSIRAAAPFFDDFVLKPRGETIALRWRERGIDDVFSGSALSSGTLRFICLATLLQQPNPPATIVLDEPELGLHPAAIHQLADLLRAAGEGRRIIAATQSVTLLGQFSVDDLAVVERVRGATTVDRPDRARLEAWLADYSLGELWEMNLLGGQPKAADATRRSV